MPDLSLPLIRVDGRGVRAVPTIAKAMEPAVPAAQSGQSGPLLAQSGQAFPLPAAPLVPAAAGTGISVGLVVGAIVLGVGIAAAAGAFSGSGSSSTPVSQ